MFRKLWDRTRRLFSPAFRENELREHLDALRQKVPVPVFWMLGKTQSGKTSLVRYLTGAERAEIGKGYQPCTRFSVQYKFPSEQAPLLTFLDTRGLDEPGYDAAEDLAKFNEEAHVVLAEIGPAHRRVGERDLHPGPESACRTEIARQSDQSDTRL